ncbi:MAG: hypothetical protein C4320_05305, partial [Armatimonadota bacterium]
GEAVRTAEAEVRAVFRSVVDQIERVTRMAQNEAKKVDWRGLPDEALTNARKALDTVRAEIEERTNGKINLGWILNDASREVELPFTLPHGKSLRIENDCGDVHVIGGDSVSEVKASVRVRAGTLEESRRVAAEYSLAVEETDGEVRIRQPHIPGVTVNLLVTIPEASFVEARADSGAIEVRDVRGAVRATSRTGKIQVSGSEGAVELKSETGSISVGAIAGGATIESNSGDVVIEGMRGDLRARSSSGGIIGRGLASGVVETETVSGAIHLIFAEAPSAVTASTVSGRIEATAPEGGSYEVDLSSLRGEVHCDFVLEESTRSAGRVAGRVGEGGRTVKLSSVSGSVDLHMEKSTPE